MASSGSRDVRFVRTRDGWRLPCYHHGPVDGRSPWGPVLLVHGLGANRYNLDAPNRRISLARFLVERGHDVWIVELRGAGRSRQPGWPLLRKPQFDFDDYVHRDIPPLIRAVLDASGAGSLHWVGHSMGGMLAYAALEHFDQRLFRSVVTVGSPAFTAMRHPWVDNLNKARFLLKLVRWLPYRRAGQVASMFPGPLHYAVGGLGGNAESMDPQDVAMMARHALYDLPTALLEQFAEWYGGEGGFARVDGLLDYYDHLKRIRAPMLIISGGGDELTPTADLRSVYESISSEDKEFLECSRANGFSVDYGHIDLILGKKAREEVYPHIARWVEKHA